MKLNPVHCLLIVLSVLVAGCAAPAAEDDTTPPTVSPPADDGTPADDEPADDGSDSGSDDGADSDDDSSSGDDPAPITADVLVASAALHAVSASGVGDAIGSVALVDVGGRVLVFAEAEGLAAGLHGFHVHQNGDCGTLEADGKAIPAGAAGGHFDPHGADHGAHAGDVGNLAAGADGIGVFMGASSAITLLADAESSVLNRSIVVHALEDDGVNAASAGARVACAVIPSEAAGFLAAGAVRSVGLTLNEVSSTGVGNSTGAAHFVEIGDVVIVAVRGSGLTAGKHGLHVHQNGDCGVTEADDKVTPAGAAGGHFDPHGGDHGAHAGDVGNLLVADDGTGTFFGVTKALSLVAGSEASILGRSVVIHALEDDGVNAASAGPRVACGVIPADATTSDAGTLLFAGFDVSDLTTDATIGAVSVMQAGDVVFVGAHAAGLTPGKHGFHVHENGACSPTTKEDATLVPGGAAGGHFNPSGADHGAHAGDLGNMVADAGGFGFFAGFTAELSLVSGDAASILDRSVIVHALEDDGADAASAGPRVACGVIPAEA